MDSDTLPEELLLKIIQDVVLTDLRNFALSSRRHASVVRDNELFYRALCLQVG